MRPRRGETFGGRARGLCFELVTDARAPDHILQWLHSCFGPGFTLKRSEMNRFEENLSAYDLNLRRGQLHVAIQRRPQCITGTSIAMCLKDRSLLGKFSGVAFPSAR